MLRTSVFASAVVAGIASLATARADGMEGSLKDAPAPVSEYLWNGFYVGVGIGAGSFDHDVGVDASKSKKLEKRYKHCYSDDCWHPVFYKEFSKSAEFSDDQWNVFGTLQIGYDRLLHKRFLIGAFADFDFYDGADNSFSEPWIEKIHGWSHEIGSIDGNIDLDHMWNIGGRLGVLVSPRILLYGVGGYSEASLDGSVDVSLKHGPSLSLATPDELHGYFVGGGGEIKLHKNLSLKVEYRYTDLDGESAAASEKWTDYWDWYCKEFRLTKKLDAGADFDAEIQSIRAALVLKLGEPERPVAALK